VHGFIGGAGVCVGGLAARQWPMTGTGRRGAPRAWRAEEQEYV
jgi:hypothetical protein